MWYLFDEVHALHRMPAIEHGLQTARGFGGAFVLGMHSLTSSPKPMARKARSIWPRWPALILATADKNTAEVCSNFIGFREVRETDEAYSIGASRSRDAATITPRTEVKPLVIPDDIMNLPSLHGYVKFPEGFPAARIRLLWRDYPKIAEPFLRKTDMQLAAYVPQGGRMKKQAPAVMVGRRPSSVRANRPWPSRNRRRVSRMRSRAPGT
jgi:type IV secretory pathway TraG/TraD family ATPase VirD4